MLKILLNIYKAECFQTENPSALYTLEFNYGFYSIQVHPNRLLACGMTVFQNFIVIICIGIGSLVVSLLVEKLCFKKI